MSKRSREKGRAFEQRVARDLRAIYGEGVHRGDQRRQGGAAEGEGADIEGTPFWVEAKHQKTVSVWAALRQADEVKARKGDPRPTLVIANQDKKPPGWTVGQPGSPVLAIMEAGAFYALLAEMEQLRAGIAHRAAREYPLDEAAQRFLAGESFAEVAAAYGVDVPTAEQKYREWVETA